MNNAQQARDPLSSVTSYAFRSLDASENKRTETQNEQIGQYQLSGLYQTKESACAPGPFGYKAIPYGTSNLALEGALDGRRRRSIEFLPEPMQRELQKEDDDYLAALSSQAQGGLMTCTDRNNFLYPINSHEQRNSRGALVTDIQVTRNASLNMPKAPDAYIMGNRPMYGISTRENAKALLGNTQSIRGMENIQKHATRIQQSGLTW